MRIPRTIRIIRLFLILCVVLGLIVGAIVSKRYWGFYFARPAVPEIARATRVLSASAVRAVASDGGCTLQQETGLRVDSRVWRVDFPELRGPIDLWSRGLLTDETPPPDWLDPSALYDAVRGSGVLVKHEIGYGSEGCFGGHVLELVLPSGGSRVVVVAGGPEMSNDHHPYYEVVFRRAGTQFTVDRTRVTFYDIAGIEGFEWPIMHAFFVLTAMLVVGSVMGVGTAILWLIKNFRYRDAH